MQKGTEVEFKSLLTEQEYKKILSQYKTAKSDFQTNHYFDTTRFSLKALDASLRVRQRDNYELTLKRKKGYNTDIKSIIITEEQFKQIRSTGSIIFDNVSDVQIDTYNEIVTILQSLIKEQKINNFLSLSTLRYYAPYASGMINIDKSDYLGITDYEIEFSGKAYHQGKLDFIQFISEYGIQYKKSEKKIKRAYTAMKNIDEE